MKIGVIVLIALSATVSLPPLLNVEESHYSKARLIETLDDKIKIQAAT